MQDLNVGVKEVKIFTNGSLAWEGVIEKVLYLYIYLQICDRTCQHETSNRVRSLYKGYVSFEIFLTDR